jgi:putative ABC transport system substrate-binding protein
VKRREFITLLGGAAAAWSVAARAQQAALPVVGYVRSTTARGFANLEAALRRGLTDAGFVDGQNVAIEFH